MTTFAPCIPSARQSTPAEPVGSATAFRKDVSLRLSRPTSRAIVIHVAGELDAATTPILDELLAPRLSSMAEAVVLDLSGLRFLGVAGLELLAQARRRAAQRSMMLGIVDGPVCVDRALHAAGWDGIVPKFDTNEAAVAALTTPVSEGPTNVLN